MTKLLENIFRSVNIALVNELAMLADRMDLDIWEIVDAAATKPFGFMRFDPGPGMGGHCLPVDPFYLTWRAREFDMPTEFIELAGEVNLAMPYFCVQKIAGALNDHSKPVRGSKVLIIGVSYKPGVGDLRESPALKMIRLLAERGAEISYNDPYVPELPEHDLAVAPARPGARGVRLRGHRHAPSGPRLREGARHRAARRRLPRRDPRQERAEPGASVTPTRRVGVVGLGYWGPNLARNFDTLPEAELAWLCDGSQEALDRWTARFPGVRGATDIGELLADDVARRGRRCDAGPDARRPRAQALEAGKHCFVEKPLAQSAADAEQVAAAAESAGKVLMVGHLLEYHPGVTKLKEIADSGELGDIHYIYGNRLNLGKLRADENALWSLGAHDVSVVLRLVGEEPSEVSAFGESYMQPGIEDVVFCFLRFPSGVAAHLHLSWLDPHKERRFTVVGSKRMATFDDMSLERKIEIYDKGFDQDFSSYGEYIARSGDIHSPRVSNEEPLAIECRHFVECIVDGHEPRSGPASGLRVVRVLEALQDSLAETGRAATV